MRGKSRSEVETRRRVAHTLAEQATRNRSFYIRSTLFSAHFKISIVPGGNWSDGA
jgi:hypothetical protein